MHSSAIDLPVISDYRLITFSVVISFIGSYTALDITGQIASTQAKPRLLWLIGGGIILGLSIWAMHFTGVLAHSLPIPVSYDFGLVVISIFVSIMGGILGIWLANQLSDILWVIGAVCVGITTVTMHYIAMASLEMAAVQIYDPLLLVLSGIISIVVALSSLWIMRYRHPKTPISQCAEVVASALCMGTGISGMHYMGIHATHIRAAPMSLPQFPLVGSRVLALVIGIAALLILLGALIASFLGRRFSAEAARVEALQQSEARLEELVRQRTLELEQEKLASEAANAAKSAFLANTSHELRTPLTAIVGFSSVLLKQIFGSLNERQLDYVQRISTSGYQLLALINDLLDLAKIESGREVLELEAVCVRAVCQSCINTVRQQAEQRGLQLILSIDSSVPACTADDRRLTQILLNLLSNAIKFTDAGSVTLIVKQSGSEVQFAVTDTGIGIAQADQERLFQPFQQIDRGLDRKYQGTGLGLALSQKLAQLQGGQITVQSTPGQGSCFVLSLPSPKSRPSSVG